MNQCGLLTRLGEAKDEQTVNINQRELSISYADQSQAKIQLVSLFILWGGTFSWREINLVLEDCMKCAASHWYFIRCLDTWTVLVSNQDQAIISLDCCYHFNLLYPRDERVFLKWFLHLTCPKVTPEKLHFSLRLVWPIIKNFWLDSEKAW